MLSHPSAGEKKRKMLTINQENEKNMQHELDGANWRPYPMPFKGLDEFVSYTISGSMRAFQGSLGDDNATNCWMIAEMQKKIDHRDETIMVLETKSEDSRRKLISARMTGSFRKPAHLVKSRGALRMRGRTFRYAIR